MEYKKVKKKEEKEKEEAEGRRRRRRRRRSKAEPNANVPCSVLTVVYSLPLVVVTVMDIVLLD